MAYSSDSATSAVDLLQKLVTWLITQGWTSNMSQAEGSGWRAHLSKAGVYVNLRAVMNEAKQFQAANSMGLKYGISLYTGSGFSGAAAWNAQAGGPVEAGTAYTVGVFMGMPNGSIPSYHFFDDGNNNITVVIEYTPGTYQHLGWGNLIKSGAFTGGAFFFGSMDGVSTGATQPGCPCSDAYSTVMHQPTSFFKADVDSFTGKWLGMTNNTTGLTGKKARSPICNINVNGLGNTLDQPIYGLVPADLWYGLQSAQVSAQNTQINLLPVRIFVDRDTYGVSLLGTIPSIYYSNATDRGFDKASTLQIGADNYVLFPYFAVKKV